MRRMTLNLLAVLAVCVLAFAAGLGGCAYSVPLTAVEQEAQRREYLRNTVEVCEVFAGHRTCTRIPRGDIGNILRGEL